MSDLDYTLTNQGSIYLLQPHTPQASAHIHGHVQSDAQWLGDALVVEHRYALDLALRLNEDGFTVRIEQ